MQRVALWPVAALLAALIGVSLDAVTRLPSADGQYWDVQDASWWSQDSGGIATGGRANPFNGFGYLKLRVRSSSGQVLVTNSYLRGFGLVVDGAFVDSTTPVVDTACW